MSDAIQTTPLYDLHRELGGRMVPFAGYQLPIQYSGGIVAEHQHTRQAAGLFDVGHMGLVRVAGHGAAEALERLLPTDVQGLAAGQQRYSFLLNEHGGVLDDLMIANTGKDFLLVVNAACKQADFDILAAGLGDGIAVTWWSDMTLFALQGPAAASALATLCPDATALRFMEGTATRVAGAPAWISRSGYTGEDGYEVAIPAIDAIKVVKALFAVEGVAPIGLGARDSLRLEAGLCLYGQDLTPDITPIEAGLNWAIPKVRRPGGARAGGYPGAERLAAQFANGTARKRVGLRPEGRAPVRAHAPLEDREGNVVGEVTSGGFGPTVGAPVAMGYVDSKVLASGAAINANVRGKPLPVSVSKLPFTPHRYHRG